jgi:lon-related putative ATP-dependent protease
MSKPKRFELALQKLRKRTSTASLGFETTEEIGCLEGLIGQQRAVEAMEFGLDVASKGYNIFVVGDHGSGRTTYSLDQLRKRADKLPCPDDWLYVYNFANAGEPMAINLPPGMGKKLSDSLTELVDELKTTLSKAFENSQYEDSKAQLVKEFQEQVNGLMESVRNWAQEKGFSIKRTPQGFVNIPLSQSKDEEGNVVSKEMQQEEFEALSETEQKQLQTKSEDVSQKTLEVLRKIRDHEKSLKEKIKNLEAEICRNAIRPYLSDLKTQYGKGDKIAQWIDALTEDIIENFNIFIAAARDENADVDFSRYSVNVFVSNEPDAGAPVVHETNSTYYNLVGKVEYESRQGYLYTDFRKIVPGAIHRANGGYLVLDAEEILRQFMSWEALKRVLRTEELSIENLGEQLGFVPVSSLRPEAIPTQIKVVIIGSRWIYYLLNLYDPEFQKLFKIKADFDVDMPRTKSTEHQLACFVASYVQKEGGLHFAADGVSEVIELASRLAGNQTRMSTHFNQIEEILVESVAWARKLSRKVVTSDVVRKAFNAKRFRSNLIEERIQRSFENGQIRIDTEGTAIGQINGLTVLDFREYMFGYPVRITANVFMGQEGIVNIEREVKMTGPIHNKGLLTLSSFLGRKFAKEMPLSLSARLAFEQTYDGIEGDSASSTELYALLSALSGIGISQSIAVTGSVDQFGNIQPIGGANEKIEGFFRCCSYRGLTGKQGVLLPKQNVINLMLDHEVLDAVGKGLFHIWAVETIEQGIEILTGIPAGIPDGEGKYPADTIYGKVMEQLKTWVEKSHRLKKGEMNNGKGEHREDASENGD